MNVQWCLKGINFVNMYLYNSFMVEKGTVIFGVALYVAPGVIYPRSLDLIALRMCSLESDSSEIFSLDLTSIGPETIIYIYS